MIQLRRVAKVPAGANPNEQFPLVKEFIHIYRLHLYAKEQGLEWRRALNIYGGQYVDPSTGEEYIIV